MVERALILGLCSRLFGFMSVFGVLLYGGRIAYLFSDPAWFWPFFGMVVVLVLLAIYTWNRGSVAAQAHSGDSPLAYIIGPAYGMTMYVNQLIRTQWEALQVASAEPSGFAYMMIMSFGKIVWFSFWISAFGAGVAFVVRLLVNRFKNT